MRAQRCYSRPASRIPAVSSQSGAYPSRERRGESLSVSSSVREKRFSSPITTAAVVEVEVVEVVVVRFNSHQSAGQCEEESGNTRQTERERGRERQRESEREREGEIERERERQRALLCHAECRLSLSPHMNIQYESKVLCRRILFC